MDFDPHEPLDPWPQRASSPDEMNFLVQQELSNLKALKRLSIGTAGTAAQDPDLPDLDVSDSSSDHNPTTDSAAEGDSPPRFARHASITKQRSIKRERSSLSIRRSRQGNSQNNYQHENRDQREAKPQDASNQNSNSFSRQNLSPPENEQDIGNIWVPAGLHPELAPNEWQAFVSEKMAAIRNSHEAQQQSRLSRHSSRLSHVVVDPEEYVDAAAILDRRRRSSSGEKRKSILELSKDFVDFSPPASSKPDQTGNQVAFGPASGATSLRRSTHRLHKPALRSRSLRGTKGEESTVENADQQSGAKDPQPDLQAVSQPASPAVSSTVSSPSRHTGPESYTQPSTFAPASHSGNSPSKHPHYAPHYRSPFAGPQSHPEQENTGRMRPPLSVSIVAAKAMTHTAEQPPSPSAATPSPNASGMLGYRRRKKPTDSSSPGSSFSHRPMGTPSTPSPTEQSPYGSSSSSSSSSPESSSPDEIPQRDPNRPPLSLHTSRRAGAPAPPPHDKSLESRHSMNRRPENIDAPETMDSHEHIASEVNDKQLKDYGMEPSRSFRIEESFTEPTRDTKKDIRNESFRDAPTEPSMDTKKHDRLESVKEPNVEPTVESSFEPGRKFTKEPTTDHYKESLEAARSYSVEPGQEPSKDVTKDFVKEHTKDSSEPDSKETSKSDRRWRWLDSSKSKEKDKGTSDDSKDTKKSFANLFKKRDPKRDVKRDVKRRSRGFEPGSPKQDPLFQKTSPQKSYHPSDRQGAQTPNSHAMEVATPGTPMPGSPISGTHTSGSHAPADKGTPIPPAHGSSSHEPRRKGHARVDSRISNDALGSETGSNNSNSDVASSDVAATIKLPYDIPAHQVSDRSHVMMYHRFPLHIERAIYRLSHMKLANPRRPLRQQVLLSNFMYAYLNVVNKSFQQQQLAQIAEQQQQQRAASISGSGLGHLEESQIEQLRRIETRSYEDGMYAVGTGEEEEESSSSSDEEYENTNERRGSLQAMSSSNF